MEVKMTPNEIANGVANKDPQYILNWILIIGGLVFLAAVGAAAKWLTGQVKEAAELRRQEVKATSETITALFNKSNESHLKVGEQVAKCGLIIERYGSSIEQCSDLIVENTAFIRNKDGATSRALFIAAEKVADALRIGDIEKARAKIEAALLLKSEYEG